MASCSNISVVIDSAQTAEAVVHEAGPPGASAYEIWLAQPGNAGKTIPEFIASLQAPISADAGNAITNGVDGGLYVPDDIASDPLAYYILAKA